MDEKNTETQLGNISFDKEKLIIKSDISLYSNTFYFTEIFSDKQYREFVNGVKKQVRDSKEYSYYIGRLSEEVDALNRDSYQGNIMAIDTDLEFHHYPLTLEDIAEAVISTKIINEEDFTSFSIAKEIIECHFEHIIGIVRLCEDNHKIAHKGGLFLNRRQVFGDYETFMLRYDKGISNAIRDKIRRLVELSDAEITSDIEGIYHG